MIWFGWPRSHFSGLKMLKMACWPIYFLKGWLDYYQTCTAILLGDEKKNWLDYGDLDPIAYVTQSLGMLKNYVSATYHLNKMVDFEQTTIVGVRRRGRADYILVTLAIFSRFCTISPELCVLACGHKMFPKVRIYVNWNDTAEKSTGGGTSLVPFVRLSIRILADPSVSC